MQAFIRKVYWRVESMKRSQVEISRRQNNKSLIDRGIARKTWGSSGRDLKNKIGGNVSAVEMC